MEYSDSEGETAPMENADAGREGKAASNDQGVTMLACTNRGNVIDVGSDSSEDEEVAGPQNPFYRRWIAQPKEVIEPSTWMGGLRASQFVWFLLW